MNKAVFLDRDGIINVERGTYTYKISDFIFVDGIIDNLKKLQEAGFLLIIITNQGGIAKNIFTIQEFEILTSFMIEELYKNNVQITEVYCCPHHSDLENCICRKPGSLMIEKSLARFEINPEKSFFIGDKDSDILAGYKLGIKGFLVKENINISQIVEQIIKA